jgi:uncharacterized membrane protein
MLAIAITLLVLEIHVPEVEQGGLWHALLVQWPSYGAYLVSFFIIGICWVNRGRPTGTTASSSPTTSTAG